MKRQTFITGRLVILTSIFLLSMGLSLPAYAQVITGTIEGTVADTTGGVLPGVNVTAVNTETQLTRQAVTDGSGRYTIPFLPAGTYQVTAELEGFRQATQQHVNVRLDERSRIDFELQVGELTDSVTVESTEPLIQTQSTDLGETIENRRVLALPLNGREFVQLALLESGATPEARFNFSSPFALAGNSPGINGNDSGQNNYLLDGISINDNTYNHLAISPSIDAIEEFKIQSSIYSAEFGSASGAQINVAVKSGTNRFHGTLYEFIRNDVLDARNFFDDPRSDKPAFQQNQFGGSLGGPILANRLFFFGNYEGLRIRKAITIASAVPTAQVRSGDFRGVADVFDPATFDSATGTAQQFPDNVIPPERIDPVAAALLERIPLPTSPGGGRNFVGTGKRMEDEDQVNGRIDWNATNNDTIFGRFSYFSTDNLEPVPGAGSQQTSTAVNRPPGFGLETQLRGTNIALSNTHIFSSSVTNQARIGYHYTRISQVPENQVDFIQQTGIQGFPENITAGVPTFTITGLSIFGDNGFLLGWRNHHFTLVDDVNFVKGAHDLKVGGLLERVHTNPNFQITPLGQFNFRQVFTVNPDPSIPDEVRAQTGDAFADFLLGHPNTSLAGVGSPQLYGRYWRFAVYLQDNWKITRNLTLNLGVRYEGVTPVREQSNKIANLDPSTGAVVVASEDGQVNPEARFEAFPNTDFLLSSEAGFPKELVESDYNNFAPRIGLAYSPGDRKTVFRAGYGIFYDRQGQANNWGVYAFNPPFFSNTLVQSFDIAQLPRTRTVLTESGTAARPSTQGIVRDFPAGYVQEWTLGIQRQFGRSHFVEATYLGTHNLKRSGTVFANQAFQGTAPIDERTPFPNFARSLRLTRAIDSGNYNSLRLRVIQRDWHNLFYSFAYSWSKNMSTTGGQNQHAARDYGLASSDIPHRFTINSTYAIPAAFTGAAGKLLNGWTITSIVSLQSGVPLTPRVPFDRSGTGLFQDRPDTVGDPNDIAHRTPERFFNTDAFALQPAGEFGNTGVNTVRGPRFDNWDFSLIKNTRFTEEVSLEFRAEFFNFSNTPHFFDPNSTFGTDDFGVIFGADSAREIQFGLKLIF